MGLIRVERVRIFCDSPGRNEDLKSPTVAMAVLLGWVKRDAGRPEGSPRLCPACSAKRKGQG